MMNLFISFTYKLDNISLSIEKAIKVSPNANNYSCKGMVLES